MTDRRACTRCDNGGRVGEPVDMSARLRWMLTDPDRRDPTGPHTRPRLPARLDRLPGSDRKRGKRRVRCPLCDGTKVRPTR